MNRTCKRLAPACAAVALGLLASCATTSPPMKLHTLVPPAPADTPAALKRADAPPPLAIAVGLPVIPDEVDRAQLVVRAADGGITMLDGERWAEPLKSSLPRALALALSRRIPGAIVGSYPGTGLTVPAWRLTLEVQRFELQRSPALQATLRVLWSLRPSSPAASPRAQLSDITLPAPGAQAGTEGAVAAMTEAIGKLADEVARDICSRAAC